MLTYSIVLFICYFARRRPIFGQCQEDSLNHLMLITAFLSLFDSKVTSNLIKMSFTLPPTHPPTPLKTLKIKILKNEKIFWRYHHFIHVYQKSQSYDVWFLIYRVRLTEFLVILHHFLSFYHPSTHLIIPKNQNFEKK